jgi:hypothetical protein
VTHTQVTDLARERWLCHSNNNDIKVKKQVTNEITYYETINQTNYELN